MKINFVFILIFNEKVGGISKVLLCLVFFRRAPLFWEGSLEKWISENPKEGRNRYAAPHYTMYTFSYIVETNLKRGGREELLGGYSNPVQNQTGPEWRRKEENLNHIFSPFALTCGTCTGSVFFSSGCAGAEGFLHCPPWPLLPRGLC